MYVWRFVFSSIFGGSLAWSSYKVFFDEVEAEQQQGLEEEEATARVSRVLQVAAVMDMLDSSALEAAASVAAAEDILKRAINAAVKNIKSAAKKKAERERKQAAAVRCLCMINSCINVVQVVQGV